MTFRLGSAIPNPLDGTSFYRACGPLNALEKEWDDFEFELPLNIDWTYIRRIDAMFLQRPYQPNHLNIIKLCKAHGKPVWIDYDDDLFTVPSNNPSHKVYNEKGITNNILTALLQADVVSVSTVQLKKKFQDILERISGDKNATVPYRCADPDKIVLVPNAYDEDMFGYSFRDWGKPLDPAAMMMTWRGSPTHDADMWRWRQPIGKAFHEFGKKWTFNFVGHPFWLFLQEMEDTYQVPENQLVVASSMDPVDYFRYLYNTKPAVVIVPLVDNPFNRSKSNVAWIEATHAGAMTIAPAWEEWRRPGILNYSNEEDLAVLMAQVLKGDVPRDTCVRESRKFIADQLILSRVNIQRLAIINRLREVDVWAQK